MMMIPDDDHDDGRGDAEEDNDGDRQNILLDTQVILALSNSH